MKTRVFSFRAPVDFVPPGISVKDFVFDLYEKAKTPVNTTVDAGVNGSVGSVDGGQLVVKQTGGRFDWGGFLIGMVVGAVLVYGYVEMIKRKYDEEMEIKGIVS